jgi:predicted aspartyl protease
MALTVQVLTVRPSRTSKRKAEVAFLLDSGAVYSLVPADILRKLGLRPYRQVTFSLADGRTVRRKVGEEAANSGETVTVTPVLARPREPRTGTR